MIKRLIFLLAMGLIFPQEYTMAAGKLIDEISALDRPERFKPHQIDDVVKKYISEGMTKEKVHQVLASEGLQTSEMKAKDLFANCTECDEVAISAGYKFESLLNILPAGRSLIIDIAFRKGKVTMVKGWYVAHAY